MKCTVRFGVFAVGLVLMISVHLRAQPARQESVQLERLVQSLTDSLNRYYIFPGKAGLAANKLLAEMNNGTYEKYLNNPSMLARQLAADINRICPDPHLSVKNNICDVPVHKPIRRKEKKMS